MEKTVLVELTSKQIKMAEGIILVVLFASLLAGFGLLSIAVPPGLRLGASVPETLAAARGVRPAARVLCLRTSSSAGEPP